MKKRIKYSYENGVLISEAIMCNDMILHIRIGKSEDKFIFMIATNVQYAVHLGNAKTIASAKKLGKAKLIELGAVFYEEIRKREVI